MKEWEKFESKLSVDQARFAVLLEQVPPLLPYWDFAEASCDVERLERDMGAWSHGEQIMGQFFVGVWLGENRLQFDLIEAASILNPKHRAIIAELFLIQRPLGVVR